MRALRLAIVLALALPVRASAEPSPNNSIAPECITLVGSNGGVPAHGLGEFLVIIRDLANNPIPNTPVTVDLSACPDLELCSDQLDPAMIVGCGSKLFTKFTDVTGSVHMTLLGGSNGSGGAIELHNAGRIYYGGGILIKAPTVSALDLDGVLGLGSSDLSAWLGDFFTGTPFGRADYDCSGSIGAGDLSVWLGAFASQAITASCGARCP